MDIGIRGLTAAMIRRGARRGRGLVGAALLAHALLFVFAPLVAADAGSGSASAPPSPVISAPAGSVPAGAQQIMDKEAYRGARWLYYVADQQSGEVLLANRPAELVFTGSTAKEFTVGAAYDTLGLEYRVTTPVYATRRAAGGVVDGDLVLVAAGDLALGGRGALDGKFGFTFDAQSVDHVYGDIAPNAVKPADDPLAGLDSLARQVAARGITRVTGDVVIDDRLWETFQGQEGAVPPIFVNDNLLDIVVTPAAPGQPATAAASPATAAFRVVSTVSTEPGSAVAIDVAADPADPHRILVTGSIGAQAGPRLTVYRVPDAASWARTLFIEALVRAGVAVGAPPVATNRTAGLPPRGRYDAQLELASLASPPLREMGTMILMTSYNTGANALLCHLAVRLESSDCVDGLKTIRRLIDKAGLAGADVFLVDGQGADPASVRPQQMAGFLAWTQTQPWGASLKAGQPVLGESGSLASAGRDSPARGKVLAKTGTSAFRDPATGWTLFNVQSLAGFIHTDDGRTLVFHLAMSGGAFPDVLTGLVQAGPDVAAVAAEFQQALSRPAIPAYATALQPRLRQLASAMLVPGAVALVRSPELGDWTMTLGTRTLGGADPVQIGDHVRVGSNTKTWTGTVILQLVQEGKLRLDDPVSKYRPDVPNGQDITITHLLNMRSGLYNYTEALELNQTLDDDPTRVYAPEELLAMAFKHPPYFPPGQGYHYSNTNTVLLGLIIEQLTGRPVEQEFEARLFAPLGMRDTRLPALASNAIPDPHPQGYVFGTNVQTMESQVLPADQQAQARAGTLLPRDATGENPSWAWTAGSGISTAEDLARFAQALAGGGLLNDELQRQRLDSIQPVNPNDPNSPGYGLGLARLGPVYGHTGELPGYNSFMGHDPARQLTVVVWTSLAATPDGRAPAVEMARAILEELYGGATGTRSPSGAGS